MNLIESTTFHFRTIPFPDTSEYTDASSTYIKLVDQFVPVLEQLYKNGAYLVNLYQNVSNNQLSYRYFPNKWTLKEVLVHLADDERIYAYRALRFARNDSHQLQGFDQDSYIRYADSSDRPLDNIIQEYQFIRLATIQMYQGFSESALLKMGSTNEWRASVRAILYHITGHEINHLKIIEKNYLKS